VPRKRKHTIPSILDAPAGLDVWQAATWRRVYEHDGPEAAGLVLIQAAADTAAGPFEPSRDPLRELAGRWRLMASLLRQSADRMDTQAADLEAHIETGHAAEEEQTEPTVQHVDPLTRRRTPA
jgi:hypothetical protein